MIYLHIPFCKQKCSYCNFHFSTSLHFKEEMMAALKKEIFLRKDDLQDKNLKSLYFGGGTPALLRPDQVHRLIKAAAPLPGAEITLEANPDVVTPENLAGFAAAGVTRISFGVQSADDA